MTRHFQIVALLVGLSVLMLRPAYPESIPLKAEGGTYVVPVLLNGKIPLDFALDSGAAEVSIPEDVFGTLRRTGTISTADLLEPGEYILADGSTRKQPRFLIRTLQVGDFELRNVVASMSPMQSNPLLGQSFLSRLQTWSVDNKRRVLLINEGAFSVATQPSVPETSAGEAGRSEPSVQSTVPAQSTQLNSAQEKMKECAEHAKAKGLIGADRMTFMASCLSAKGVSEEDINKAQQKMKTCNAEASTKGLRGDDRKAFMKACLTSG